MIVQYIPISAEGKNNITTRREMQFFETLSCFLPPPRIFNVKWKKILMRMLLNAAITRFIFIQNQDLIWLVQTKVFT